MRKVTFVSIFLFVMLTLSAQTNGELNVSVSTAATGIGYYAPSHVMAVWVEDSNGKFIKTLLEYGTIRSEWLDLWNQASGGDKTDAITGATRTSHTTRTCSWNGRDVNGSLVSDGDYVLQMQLTDDDFSGKNASFPFTKGTTVSSLNPTDVLPSFTAVSMSWIPDNTAVTNIYGEILYKVYPNPVVTEIYVTGFGIRKVSVLNLNGKTLKSASGNRISVTSFKAGTYLLQIFTGNGIIVRKFEKILN
ncbi:MAG: DUF2271 domain-containing protein [Paludibacter sp.]|nr:DUF2271 domain-containing protein [Paludibacter sp.]